MKRYLVSCLIGPLLVGCAHSVIVPFHAPTEKGKVYPPTDPQSVAIYRSQHPFISFVELGLITYRADNYDLAAMYGQLRKDSAAYGAQAVVDVKTSKESHAVTEPEQRCHTETNCDASGVCSNEEVCNTEWVSKDESTYLVTGSMIREKL